MKDGFYWVRTMGQRWEIAKVSDGNIYWAGMAGGSRVTARGMVTTYSLGEERSTYYHFSGPISEPKEFTSR